MAVASSRPEGYDRARPVQVLTLATLAQVAASAAQQGLIVLVVFFRVIDHLSLVAMGGVAASVTFGTMVGMIPSGAVVDRMGVARGAVVGCLGLVACLVGLYLATPAPVDVLVVLLAGVGAFAASMPVAGARAVLAAFPAAQRGMAMGIRQSGVTIGAALAAALLPTLALLWGLRDVILILAAPVAVFGAALARSVAALPSPAREVGRTADGAARARGGARTIALISIAGALLAAGQYDTLAYAITYLHASLGMRVALAGGVLAAAQVGGTLSRVGIGLLSDRLGIGRAHAVAGLAALGCVGLTLFSLVSSPTYALWLGLAFILGTGAIGWNALILTWAAENAASAQQATAIGVSGAAIFLGATVFPPVFGAVASATGSLPDAWRSVALLYVIATALCLLIARSAAGSGVPARRSAKPARAAGG